MRYRRNFNSSTNNNNDVNEKKEEEEKPIETSKKFGRKNFYNNNVQEKVEEPKQEIKPAPKHESTSFKRSYFGKFRRGKSTLDEETPKEIIKEQKKEETNYGRFQKHHPYKVEEKEEKEE